MKQNDTPPPRISAASLSVDRLTFDLEDGRSVSVPLAWYPTLLMASEADRSQFEIIHSSVYWPTLDCDISSQCLLRGAKEDRRWFKAPSVA